MSVGIFFIAIVGNLIAIALHYLLSKGDQAASAVVVRNVLLSIIGAQALYLVYALGWLPGSSQIQQLTGSAGALLVAFVGGLLPFVTDRFLPQSHTR